MLSTRIGSWFLAKLFRRAHSGGFPVSEFLPGYGGDQLEIRSSNCLLVTVCLPHIRR